MVHLVCGSAAVKVEDLDVGGRVAGVVAGEGEASAPQPGVLPLTTGGWDHDLSRVVSVLSIPASSDPNLASGVCHSISITPASIHTEERLKELKL